MSDTTTIPSDTHTIPRTRAANGTTGGTNLSFAGSASMLALPSSRCHAIDLPGPEDVVVDAETGLAWVASQARPRNPASNRADAAPGAIFSLRLDDPEAEPRNATPKPVGGFEPSKFHAHGIDLFVDGTGAARLFAVNHHEGGSRIEVFDIVDRYAGKLEHLLTVGPDPALTDPNDIAAAGLDEIYVSNFHAAGNSILGRLERFVPLPTASVAYCRFGADLSIVETGFTLLSGIAIDRFVEPKCVYVAPMWSRKIVVYEQTADGGLKRTGREIPLPGGADNLNFDASGALWIGAAPDLLAVGAYTLGHRPVAPSLVLRIPDPRAEVPEIRTVFSDDGRLISAASAAACWAGPGRRVLLIGAPFQDRLVVIELG